MNGLSKSEQEILLNGPAGDPPPGVTPDFVNPPNLDGTVWAALTVMLLVTTVVGSLRLYTKHAIIRSWTYEDYAILVAWIGIVSYNALGIKFVQSGGGKHMWDIHLRDFLKVVYWTTMAGIVYCITIFLVKLSILLQFLRIFVPNRKASIRLYVAIHTVIWSSLFFYIAILIIEIDPCIPQRRNWSNLLLSSGHCINPKASDLATGIFNIGSDFSILILPIIPISHLQMPMKRKVLMIMVFATGIFACATSILGTFYRWKLFHSQDESYESVTFGLWTEAELVVGFLISCFPVMPKFFQHVGPKISKALSRGPGIVGTRSHERLADVKIDNPNPSVPPTQTGGNYIVVTHHNDYGYHYPSDVSATGRGNENTLDDAMPRPDRAYTPNKISQESLSGWPIAYGEPLKCTASMV